LPRIVLCNTLFTFATVVPFFFKNQLKEKRKRQKKFNLNFDEVIHVCSCHNALFRYTLIQCTKLQEYSLPHVTVTNIYI
jgi:hypothetical protein